MQILPSVCLQVQNSVHRDVIGSMSPEIDRLKCANEGLESQVTSLNEKMRSLMMELEKRKTEFEKRKSEGDCSRSKVTTLERKLEEANYKLADMESQVCVYENITKELETKTAESDNITVDLLQMTDRCADLEKRLAATQSDLAQATKRRGVLEEACNDYSKKLASLKQQTNHSEQLQANFDIKVAENQALQTQVNSLIKQCDQMKEQVTEFETRLSKANEANCFSTQALQQKLDTLTSTNKSLESSCQELKHDNSKLTTRLNELSLQYNSLQATNAPNCLECTKKQEAFEAKEAKLLDLTNECSALKENLTGMKSEVETYQSKITERDQETQELENRAASIHPCQACAEKQKSIESNLVLVADLRAAICRLGDWTSKECEQCASYQGTINSLTNSCDEKDQRIVDLTQQLADRTGAAWWEQDVSEESDSQPPSKHVSEETAALKDDAIQELQEEKSQLEIKMDDIDNERRLLAEQLEQEKAKNEDLVERLKKAENYSEEQHGEIADLEAHIGTLQGMEAQFSEFKKKLSETQAKLEVQATQHKAAQQKHETEMEKSKAKTMELELKLSEAQKKRAQSADDSELIESLKQQIYSLTQNLNSSQARNDSLVMELDKVISEKRVYIDEISKLATELKSVKSDLDDHKDKLQAMANDHSDILNETNKSLEFQLDNSRELYLQSESQLQTQIDDLRSDNQNLIEEAGTCNARIVNLMEALARQEEQSHLLNAQISELRDLSEGLKEERSTLCTTNNALVEQLEMVSGELESVKENAQESQNKSIYLHNKEIEKLKTDMTSLLTVNKALSEERNDFKHRLSMMKKPAESSIQLQEENENLKRVLAEVQADQLDQLTTASAESCIMKAQLDNALEQLKSCESKLRMGDQMKALATELQTRLREEQAEKSSKEVELQQIIEELQELKEERMTFKEQLTHATEKYEHLQEQCDELKQSLEQITFERKHEACVHESTLSYIQKDLDEANASVDQLRSQLSTACDDLASEQDLRKQTEHLLASKEEVLANVQSDTSLEKANDKVCLLESELAGTIAKLNAAEEKVAELNSMLMREEQRCSEALEKLNSVSGEREREVELESSLQAEMVTLRIELEEERANHQIAKSAVAVLQESADREILESVKSDNARLEEYLACVQDENKMLLTELQVLRDETASFEVQLTQSQVQLREVTADLKQHNDLREKHDRLSGDNEHLRERLSICDKRIDELTNSLNTMESSKRSVLDELESVRAQNLEMMKTLGKFEADRSAQSIGSLQEEIDTLTQKLGQSEQQMEASKCIIHSLETEKLDIESQLSALQDKTSLAETILAQVGSEHGEEGHAKQLKELAALVAEKSGRITELEETMDVLKTYHSAAELATEDRVKQLTMELTEKDETYAELQEKLTDLEKQILELTEESDEEDEPNYKKKWQRARNQIDVLEFDYESMEAKYQEAVDSKTNLTLELATVKQEKERLAAQIRTSPRVDESNADGVEYLGLQRQIIELKQQLTNQTKAAQALRDEQSDFDRKLNLEKNQAAEARAEVEKLKMSINILMSTHKTEMESMRRGLETAGSTVADLESQVIEQEDAAFNRDKAVSLLNTQVIRELNEIKEAKAHITNMMGDLVKQNSLATQKIQEHLAKTLREVQTDHNTSEEKTSLSASLPMDSLMETSVSLNLSGSFSLALRNDYTELTKDDLVAKLVNQTKHELVLKKNLDDARQSLNFYRSAIDNIIDCLGNTMPGVKKWAHDLLNVSPYILFHHLIEPTFTHSTGIGYILPGTLPLMIKIYFITHCRELFQLYVSLLDYCIFLTFNSGTNSRLLGLLEAQLHISHTYSFLFCMSLRFGWCFYCDGHRLS